MRTAPAVSVHGSGGRPWRWFAGLLAGCAASSLLATALAHAQWPAAPAGLALLLAAALTAWRRLPPAVHLVWDGRAWTADGQAVTLSLVMDLGFWMLLRLRAPSGASRWLPVARADAGPAWHGLRVAVHGQGGAKAAPADVLPGARHG